MFCPVALHLLATQKREGERRVAERCGAINMTQAAAKEVLKGLEEEKRIGSLMGWTTARERGGGQVLLILELHLCSRGETGRKALGEARRRAANTRPTFVVFFPLTSPGWRKGVRGGGERRSGTHLREPSCF